MDKPRLTFASAIHALALINLIALLLPARDSVWEHAAVCMPWVWVLLSREMREELCQVLFDHRALALCSLAFSILVLIGYTSRQIPTTEWRIAAVPLVWIPVATFARTQWRMNYSWISNCVLASIVATTLLLGWQFFILANPRPPGLSFNVLIGPLLMMQACAYYILNPQRNPQLRTSYLIATTAVIGAIITQSKSALIAFSVAWILSSAISKNNSKRIIFTCLPFSATWYLLIQDRFRQINSDIRSYELGRSSSSFGDRIDAIQWSIEHIPDHPWLGFGPTQLTQSYNQRWIEWGRDESSITKMLHLHNDYIQIPLSYGALALILISAIYLIIYKTIKKSHFQEQQKMAFGAFLAIFLTASIFDSYSYWIGMWGACFTSIGLILSKAGPEQIGDHHA